MFAPGIPLIGGGGGAASGYTIGKSLRTRSSATAYLSRTFGAPTNQNVWTFSCWLKRGKLGAIQTMLGRSGTTLAYQFGSADTFGFFDGGSSSTTSVYRDPSGWLHFHLKRTASNSVSLYINGVFVATDTGAANFNINGATYYIGRSNAGEYFDGNIAEVRFIDGQALDASSFAQTDSVTGAFVPKAYTGTYGNNGFYLDFSDNSAATAAAIGADRSGNGNNWTPNNISVTAGVTMDSLTDTPTNNHCVLSAIDPPDAGGSNNTTDGNLAISTAAATKATRGTFYYPSTGKWVYEATDINDGANQLACGVAALPASWPNGTGTYWVYRNNGQKEINGTGSAYGASWTTNDVIRVEYDAGAGTLEFFKNGTSQGQITGVTGTLAPYVGCNSGRSIGVNFGQRAFANTPTSGFVALNSANLPTPTIKKLSNAYVAVTDIGTNIQATLATARSGWGADNYLEMFKDRSNLEGWRFRFGDDTANYLDSTSTNGKAAFPALVGADSYVGYALRMSTAYGMATGTFAHTNGVTDTITDNVGNSRKFILLKRTDAGGNNWIVYHPDLTAGKLLYLNATTNETTDASINTVTSNSFKADTTLPTGTYRWVAIAETPGLVKLGTYTGNGSSDGPFNYANELVACLWAKDKSLVTASGHWTVHDSTRDKSNAADSTLAFNLTNAEASLGATSTVDLLSNGWKPRLVFNDYINSTSTQYIYVAFGSPFKYANAR